MRKRLLLIGLLVVGVALLSGCELLDQIAGGGIPGGDIPGGDTPGGGTASPGGEVVDVYIMYGLTARISEQLGPDDPITTRVANIGAAFSPETVTYNADTKTFIGTWDDDWHSDTYLELRLSSTEEYVDYFYVKATEDRWSPAAPWTYVDELRGYNVHHSSWSSDRTICYYIVEGTDYRGATYDAFTYEKWDNWDDGLPPHKHEWANTTYDIVPSSESEVYIRVHYSEPQP